MFSNQDVLKSLLVTEKGSNLVHQDKYIFKVDLRANKIQIKKAVQDIYKVKVTKVNKMIMAGKFKRLRHKGGYTSKWAKAIVTLKQGDKIEMAQ